MKLLVLIFANILFGLTALAAVDGDNSAVNQRDSRFNEFTAEQQGTSKQDTEITRQIRQALMKDKSLSTYAKNVKIITTGGKVTLKGPVRSINEQKILVRTVQNTAGVSDVFNQTDIVAE